MSALTALVRELKRQNNLLETADEFDRRAGYPFDNLRGVTRQDRNRAEAEAAERAADESTRQTELLEELAGKRRAGAATITGDRARKR